MPALRVAAEAVVRLRRVQVVGDEQIQIAVAVHVEERAAGAPARESHARLARDVGEHAVAVVAIQRVGAVARDVEIDAAVVVHVAGARAHAVVAGSRMRDRAVTSAKRAVALVAEQPMPGLGGHRRVGDRAAVHQKEVEPAVGVEVEEDGAGAHGLGQILLRARAAGVPDRDARRLGHVLKHGRARASEPVPAADCARVAGIATAAAHTPARATAASRLTGRPLAAPAGRVTRRPPHAAPTPARANSPRSCRRCASIAAFWMRSNAASSCRDSSARPTRSSARPSA